MGIVYFPNVDGWAKSPVYCIKINDRSFTIFLRPNLQPYNGNIQTAWPCLRQKRTLTNTFRYADHALIFKMEGGGKNGGNKFWSREYWEIISPKVITSTILA